MDDILGYRGQHVVVSGAASGMGAATAALLSDLGADVTALDVRPLASPVGRSLQIDLRDRASIDAAARSVPGEIAAYFGCAGLPGGAFSDGDVMLVNYIGARHLIESLIPKMAAGGAVASIASMAGVQWQSQSLMLEFVTVDGFEDAARWHQQHQAEMTPAYRASKQAMNAWVALRSSTLITGGIRLNTVNPGPTETPMMPSFEESAGGADVIDQWTRPIGRRSTALEQAWALVLLNSPHMSYVNGHALNVDGGWFAAVQTGRIVLAPRPA